MTINHDSDRHSPPQVVYVQSEKNGLGTSSFILGLLASIFGLTPIGAFIALPVGVVGLGLGLGNIGRLRRHVAVNRTMTVLGIILCIVGIVLSIVGLVIINNAFSGG